MLYMRENKYLGITFERSFPIWKLINQETERDNRFHLDVSTRRVDWFS